MTSHPTSAGKETEVKGLPVLLSALVAGGDDAREFRRYPVRLDVGVGHMPHDLPHYGHLQTEASDEMDKRLCQRSIVVRDLSLTGLYFVSALPYRQGSLLEIQLPFSGHIITLPCRVRRLDFPARTPEGILDQAYGCAVHFLLSQINSKSRRTLMQFLLQQQIGPNASLEHL